MDNHQKIMYMMEFTDTYRGNSDDIYKREAECLRLQYSYSMLPLREEDFIAGRKTMLPIGFYPQTPFDSVGYYMDEASLLKLWQDDTLKEEERQSIDHLIRFWKGNTTKDKIIARYTGRQRAYLSLGDYTKDKGIAFPLYRMSGAQMDPGKLLKKGIPGLMNEADNLLGRNPRFYSAVRSALVTLREVCLRYRNEVKEQWKKCHNSEREKQLLAIADNLEYIAYHAPETFWQATQLSYLYFLLSGTFNYGRMDVYLGDYLAKDLEEGRITGEFALELMQNLWSLIIEQKNYWDGRVILGGKDRRNPEAADRLAMLAMEASRRKKDVLPQLTLRCYRGMNQEVYDKALQVIGEGTTYPMLYNDEVTIPAVQNAFCVDEKTASEYVPFGCGEFVLYNQSFGTPSGTINLLLGLNSVIYDGEQNYLESCLDFDTFYQGYLESMSQYIDVLAEQEKLEYEVCAEDAPYLYFSILFDDCLERGAGIFEGGIKFLGGTLESYGNINTSDSLTAIKKLVYDQKLIKPEQLTQALRNNFQDCPGLRQMLLAAPKYGNDDDEADGMAVRLHSDICHMVRSRNTKAGLHSYLAVIINNSMNTTFGLTTGASADGRYANTYMANANNPTGGMDKSGITAMLNSLVKLKTVEHAGSVQNMRFSREMFTRLMDKTKNLLEVYFNNGGSQAMISVLNRGDLEEAVKTPEKYQNLIVRVGGFSARFVELSREVQMELLSRTLY